MFSNQFCCYFIVLRHGAHAFSMSRCYHLLPTGGYIRCCRWIGGISRDESCTWSISMASKVLLLLQLLPLLSLVSASHHFGGMLSYTYKGTNPDGTFKVRLSFKHLCSVWIRNSVWMCFYLQCDTEGLYSWYFICHFYYYSYLCY